jgi:hypothetical protein
MRPKSASHYRRAQPVFLARLVPLHITYRIIHIGVLDALITSRDVRQEQVGMGAPFYR